MDVRYYGGMRRPLPRKVAIVLVVALAVVYLIAKADQWYTRHRAQPAAEAHP